MSHFVLRVLLVREPHVLKREALLNRAVSSYILSLSAQTWSLTSSLISKSTEKGFILLYNSHSTHSSHRTSTMPRPTLLLFFAILSLLAFTTAQPHSHPLHTRHGHRHLPLHGRDDAPVTGSPLMSSRHTQRNHERRNRSRSAAEGRKLLDTIEVRLAGVVDAVEQKSLQEKKRIAALG
jgi:hypothetical protein